MKIKTLALMLVFALISLLPAQTLIQNIGDEVPEDLEDIYKNGLRFLAKTQSPKGSWGSYNGVGITSLCVLSFLAHGEDPNFGPYKDNIQKGIKSIIKSQQKTGMLGSSMYHHGYATLALAESYGAIMDPTIGPALEKAVKLMLKSQDDNIAGGWRYSPGDSQTSDTSVAGACLVGMLAAKNAGIAVPQKNIDRALSYFARCQANDGGIGYTNSSGGNMARTSIGALVFAVGRNRDNKVYTKAVEWIIKNSKSSGGGEHNYSYMIYYQAQAYFQSDMKVWWKWNQKQIAIIKKAQGKDGGILLNDSNGADFSTAMALLSLALNYRYLPIYER